MTVLEPKAASTGFETAAADHFVIRSRKYAAIANILAVAFSIGAALWTQLLIGSMCPKERGDWNMAILVAVVVDLVFGQPLFVGFVAMWRWLTADSHDGSTADVDGARVTHPAFPIHGLHVPLEPAA